MAFDFLGLSLMRHIKHQESIAAKFWFSDSTTWDRESGLGMTACLDRSIIRIAHNMIPNNMEELESVQ